MSAVEEQPITTTGEIVTSTGAVNTIEERSYNRVYLTDERTYSNVDELFAQFNGILNYESTTQPVLRRVFRTFATREVVTELLETDLGRSALTTAGTRIEMVLELEQFVPEVDRSGEDRYLITIAQNFHPSEVSEAEIARGMQFVERSWAGDVHDIERGHQLLESQDSQLTRNLSEADILRLTELWGPTFGWTETQVENFVHTYRSNPDLWFSGVRNSQGVLTGASMAERVRIGDIEFIELTEWITTTSGTASKMISGLIAQVLETYSANPGQKLPVIVAEMNLHHVDETAAGSPGAGVSAGLVLPASQHVALGGSENTLRHNVQVLDGRSSAIDGTQLNNFMMGTLPLAIVERYYSPAMIAQVINHYHQET